MSNRISFKCPGDCSKCKLLQEGRVNMLSCISDQMFQIIQAQNKTIEELSSKLDLVYEAINESKLESRELPNLVSNSNKEEVILEEEDKDE